MDAKEKKNWEKRMRGTFNQGWWNCFESFAAELLFQNQYAEDICTSVLTGAGITKREASSWLERSPCNNPKVVEVVRNYWLSRR